jgi:hypothetical protein
MPTVTKQSGNSEPSTGASNGFVAEPLADCPVNLRLSNFRIDLLG